MSNFSSISSSLVTILSGVQQNGQNAFVQVLDYPTLQFTGFPSATIVPDGVSSSQFATVIQNRRSYAFQVAIFVSVANPTDMSVEFAVMRILVDSVLDAIEKTTDLGGLVNWIVPTPMKWQVVSNGASGQLLAAPIQFTAEKDVLVI